MDHTNCKTYGTKIHVCLANIIGHGATAVVYQGYYESEELPAAVKVMNKAKPKNSERFKAEVEAFIELKKRNVPGAEHLVSYYGMEETDDQYILAMELCHTNLADFIMKGTERKAKEYELKKYVAEICRGLSILHSVGNCQEPIVHRDLKPANVLIKKNRDGSCNVKLADFGISKFLPNNHSATATATGSDVWMSPACITAMDRKEKYKASTKDDIFSFGMLIYFVMSRGNHPFGFYSEQMSNIKHGRHRLDDYVEKNFAFQNLVRAMIQKEPEKRPRIDEVIKHPFFWDDDFNLDFVRDSSNLHRSPNSTAEFLDVLQNRFRFICNCEGDGWKTHFSSSLFVKNKYNGQSLVSLMKFIRDKYEHRVEWGENFQLAFGSDSTSYMRIFREHFPALILALATTKGIEYLGLNQKFHLPSQEIFQLIATNVADCSRNRALED